MPEIRVNDDAGVRTITFDRPAKKNALTTAMYGAIADALASAEHDAGVGAIVFAGAGADYTSGNDLRDFVAFEELSSDAPVVRFLFELARSPVPLIAAVRGRAIGVGVTMLLHCDLVYASETAKFALPFVDLGLVPEAASTLLLPRAAGHRRASELLLTGKTFDAAAAVEYGIANVVCADAELDSRALDAARSLVKKPRAALRATKKLLKGDAGDIVARMQLETDEIARLLRTSEARAAFAAILAK